MAITPIYTRTPQNASLNAGSLTMWAEIPTSEGEATWRKLDGNVNLPELSATASSVDQSTVEDADGFRYISGRKDGAEGSIQLYFYKDDADQKAFFEAAQANKNVLLKVQYKGGLLAQCEIALLGYNLPSGGADEVQSITINFKISGSIKITYESDSE